MIPLNRRRNSAWGKAHRSAESVALCCDYTLAPNTRTPPFRANAVSRIEPDYAEPQLCQRAPSALRGITVPRRRPAQNSTHLHHVSDFKISSAAKSPPSSSVANSGTGPRLLSTDHRDTVALLRHDGESPTEDRAFHVPLSFVAIFIGTVIHAVLKWLKVF